MSFENNVVQLEECQEIFLKMNRDCSHRNGEKSFDEKVYRILSFMGKGIIVMFLMNGHVRPFLHFFVDILQKFKDF